MVVAVGATFGSAPVAFGNTVTPMCTTELEGAHVCKAGWYTTPVLLNWVWSPMSTETKVTPSCEVEHSYTMDTNGTVSCSVSWTSPPDIIFPYTIHVELSSPSATAVLARPPDFNGWYNHPVGVSFQGSAFSGIASCSPAMAYGGPDRMNASVSGSCTDNAGKEAEASVSFPYDGTPPTITEVIPSRQPDYNGWYNHPVSFAFIGADATSGIESCTTPTYSGPDNGNAQVIGSCRDRAGNVADFRLPIRYQATPPWLTVAADPGDGSVFLHWQASEDVAIARSPGLKGAPSSVVYQGNSGSYDDTQVRNGVHYQYTLTAQDQAGNATVRSVFATPGARLLAPALNAHLSAPPVLHWTVVPGASYYNVQLYYRGGKVLSVWPKQPTLPLKQAWNFAGRHHRLKPGLYRWYVWPGFGRRARARYGSLIGTGSFVFESPKPS
jgi:hypothetical protein